MGKLKRMKRWDEVFASNIDLPFFGGGQRMKRRNGELKEAARKEGREGEEIPH